MTRQKLSALIAAIQSLRTAADDTMAAAAKDLYPSWKSGVTYSVGDRVLYNGVLYRCLQMHNALETWNPVDAVSLWAEVLIPDPDVISEWKQPDATNPYMTGDKVTHNGKTWICTIDNNVWEPGVYGWNEV